MEITNCHLENLLKCVHRTLHLGLTGGISGLISGYRQAAFRAAWLSCTYFLRSWKPKVGKANRKKFSSA
jgi:hypothetical protein